MPKLMGWGCGWARPGFVEALNTFERVCFEEAKQSAVEVFTHHMLFDSPAR